MKKAASGPGVDKTVVGYTILETMIFLTVSAVLFVSAMTMFSGRQGRAEFATGVKQLESQLQDLANDVADGYYSNGDSTGKFISCYADSAGAHLSSVAAVEQGANTGCIVIGKAIHFSPTGSNNRQMVAMPLFGRQFVNGLASNGDVTNFNLSGGSGIFPGAPGTGAYANTPNASQTLGLDNGVTIECVLVNKATARSFSPIKPNTYNTPCTDPTVTGSMDQIDAIAYLTTFHGTSLANESVAGGSDVNLVISKPTLGGQRVSPRSTNAVVDELLTYTMNPNATPDKLCDPADAQSTTCINPPNGIYICVQSSGSNQYAFITIGGSVSEASTSSDFQTGKCK